MVDATLANNRFEIPSSFDFTTYLEASLAAFPARWQVEVWLDLTPEVAIERIPDGYGTVEAAAEGVIFRSRHDELRPIALLLAGLGCRFSVIDPPELQTEIETLAESLKAMTALPWQENSVATT